MEALFLKLLNMSITAGWLVLAVVILRLVLKKAPRAMICLLWALVAVRLLVPVSVESMFSLIPDPEPIQTQPVQQYAMTHSPEFLASAIAQETAEAVGSAPKADGFSVLSVVTGIWLAGMAVMALYAVISYLLVLRRTNEAAQKQNGVWHCDRIETPFILGVFRPRIFLPSSVDPNDAEFVLAHEQAHLKRLDHLWKPLGFLLLTVYWFNPLLWLAYVLLCRDIEVACDERVLQQLGTEHKKAYSTALINCSVPRRMISACPLAFGENDVKNRVKSILNYKKPAFWIIIVAIVASAAVAVCFLTNPEKKQQENAVGLKLMSMQTDSVTVQWNNDTDLHVVIGYDTLYVKIDGQWKEQFYSVPGNMGQGGWTKTLKPGQVFQQIIYYYYAGITQPGEYRLDMKYTDQTGAEVLLPLEFKVESLRKYEGGYEGPIWRTKLSCEESPDVLKPTILLSDDGRFQFQYSGLSSYVAWGSYEENSRELILRTDDAQQVYRLIKDGATQYRFDAENSTALPKYKYDGQDNPARPPVPDGGLFEQRDFNGRIMSGASVPAFADGDDIAEYWNVIYRQEYGLSVFEITAVDPEGKILYRDIFQYECTSLSLYKTQDGTLQLLATNSVKLAGERLIETVSFDISVENGHIKLTSPNETLRHLDFGTIS